MGCDSRDKGGGIIYRWREAGEIINPWDEPRGFWIGMEWNS